MLCQIDPYPGHMQNKGGTTKCRNGLAGFKQKFYSAPLIPYLPVVTGRSRMSITDGLRRMRRRYLHLQNTHHLFGGFTSAALQVLENGLAAWDADSGIPSLLIQHNQTSSKPPTFSSAVAGVVAEEGKGSRFVVEPNGGEGRAPELQVRGHFRG